MSSNNVGHLITSTIITLQHFTTLHHTSPNYTSPHFTKLHFTTLHQTTLHYTSPNYTSPHFTSSHFNIIIQCKPTKCKFCKLIKNQNQKDRKEAKIRPVDVTFCLDVFWTTAWAFFSKTKSDLIDILFNYLCNFLYT